MAGKRDDFTKAVKDALARRVGQLCSNPKCWQPTYGPRSEPKKWVCVGVAAHITAAAPGGPRYDPNLTSEQRSAVGNGIWLCEICAKLIDSDPARYTTALLHEWKEKAEEDARTAIAAPSRAGRPAAAGCPWCDERQREEVERWRLLERRARSKEVDEVAQRERDAHRAVMAERGQLGSGGDLDKVLELRADQFRRRWEARLEVDRVVIARLCRAHQDELQQKLADEVASGCAAGERAGCELVESQLRRAAGGPRLIASAKAKLRRRYAVLRRAAATGVERAIAEVRAGLA